MVTNVDVFVNTDRRVTLQEVANQFSINKTSDYTQINRYEQGKCCVDAKTSDRRPIGSQSDHGKRTFGEF